MQDSVHREAAHRPVPSEAEGLATVATTNPGDAIPPKGGTTNGADAQELVQEVLIAVSKSAGRFVVDRQRGRFRTWLYAIGRNICLQQLARLQARERANGGPSTDLADLPDSSTPSREEFDTELKRHAFLWVARNIRHEFQTKTWESFWRTAVQNHSIQSTAEDLQISVGAVYVARSRVMARLRSRVQEITLDGLPDAVEIVEQVSEGCTAAVGRAASNGNARDSTELARREQAE